MSWSPEEIGHYYQLMCLQKEDSLWDLCIPMLQYSKEKIWIEVLGIKDTENLNDDKKIEECFAVEVDHNGLMVNKK